MEFDGIEQIRPSSKNSSASKTYALQQVLIRLEIIEQQVKDLLAQLASKEEELTSQKSAYETLWEGHEQARAAIEKDRDSHKHQLQEMIKVLKSRELYEDVIREANGGIMPIQLHNHAFGEQAPSVLDEY